MLKFLKRQGGGKLQPMCHLNRVNTKELRILLEWESRLSTRKMTKQPPIDDELFILDDLIVILLIYIDLLLK